MKFTLEEEGEEMFTKKRPRVNLEFVTYRVCHECKPKSKMIIF